MSFYEYAYQNCKKLLKVISPKRGQTSAATTNPTDASKKVESPRGGVSVETSRKS
jgi:hypothetical protein